MGETLLNTHQVQRILGKILPADKINKALVDFLGEEIPSSEGKIHSSATEIAEILFGSSPLKWIDIRRCVIVDDTGGDQCPCSVSDYLRKLQSALGLSPIIQNRYLCEKHLVGLFQKP